MRKIIDSDIITMMVRILLGGMFIYAAVHKILDPGGFAKSIWYYHILPGQLINVSALLLPWLELLAGLALIVGAYYRGGVFWINILLVIFIAALASTILRGIDVDCGCFKAAIAASEPAWDQLWIDVGLLVLGVYLIISRSRRWQLANMVS